MSLPVAARRAVSAVFFVDGAALGGWVAHIPDAKASMGLSDRVLGLALLASAIGAVTTMPFAGTMIRRLGSRNLSLLSGLLLCLVLPFLLVAETVPVFVVFHFLVGVFNGQLDVAMNTHSMAVQDRYSRPIISAVHGWFSVGGFAGAFGAAVGAWVGVSPVLHMSVASLGLAALLIWQCRDLLPTETDQGSADQSQNAPKIALPKGPLLILGFLVMFSFMAEGAMWDWSSVYLRDVLKSSEAVGSLGFGFGSLMMAAGRFWGDHWIHLYGPKRVLFVSAILSGGGLLLAVGSVVVPMVTTGSPQILAAIFGFGLMGLGLANLVPILFRAASQVPGILPGFGLAAVTTVGYTAFLGGPPLIGIVADATTLDFALGTIAVLCLMIAIIGRRVV